MSPQSTDSAQVMTLSQFRGMWKMHIRAERAYRSVGNVQQAEAAKACRERLEVAYPQYAIPTDTNRPTAEQVAAYVMQRAGVS